MTASYLRRVKVAEVERVASRIKRFRLVDVENKPLSEFSGGSHVTVCMRAQDRVIRNPYSLMGCPSDTSSYQISVLKVDNSRGGSQFMHDNVVVGTELEISEPLNLFPPAKLARKHILVAGGIGITPFMSMMSELDALGSDFELHYGVRSAAEGAFCKLLEARYGSRIRLYLQDQDQMVPLERILSNQRLGAHMYVCGPKPMIDWALRTATLAGWPDESIHSEQFNAPPIGKPFVVKLARSRREITVGGHQSILEALEQNGIDAPFLCRGGACGQCETEVSGCDGFIEHNDHYLSEAEKASGRKIMICVSRISGDAVTLDL
ncbi:MAG: oxidoreductase [Hyphomicrobium zavarzinii]|jgi:ferredoxin-NADP reductase|uniref:PDR/VanB family oxidoreductase n=1 Tax=Hyphomicrobium TaxID=81 RepID=UPI0003711F3F|nr:MULTISPECIES: PDR/VanB family oxidoreductase [Hyphomicrobium]MBL8845533.1 oxidoreductase [Hyphomicrobium zavarzinii]WBT37147.1 PDR/VanB family oxidoreductase [Hyphomicrobium sp. DMF-1]HML41426.1 PDR/VanB family oxidoreductase [Hyphomicrobium zavarzinii]